MAVEIPATVVRVLVDGLGIVESPRWHDGRLWFSHWGAEEVLVASTSTGTARSPHRAVPLRATSRFPTAWSSHRRPRLMSLALAGRKRDRVGDVT